MDSWNNRITNYWILIYNKLPFNPSSSFPCISLQVILNSDGILLKRYDQLQYAMRGLFTSGLVDYPNIVMPNFENCSLFLFVYWFFYIILYYI